MTRTVVVFDGSVHLCEPSDPSDPSGPGQRHHLQLLRSRVRCVHCVHTSQRDFAGNCSGHLPDVRLMRFCGIAMKKKNQALERKRCNLLWLLGCSVTLW